MKITYNNGFGPRETYDYDSPEELIEAFRAAYGEEAAARVKIISAEPITRADDPRADYFSHFGTEHE